jgi:hypothetical protein
MSEGLGRGREHLPLQTQVCRRAILFIIIIIFIFPLTLLRRERGEMWAGDEEDNYDQQRTRSTIFAGGPEGRSW